MRLTGKYRYLTFEDRKKIEAWHLLGDRPVDIAARLSVHHTTIYKELQRGATGALDANQREGYSAELAERRLRESFKRRGKRAPAAQYSLHAYLAMMAIVAVNSDIDVSDLERISGPDVMELMRIGRNFTTARSAAQSEESGSESSSETTLEPSTPQSASSGGNA